MKTYLKRLLIPILSGLIVCSFYSCNSDDEHTATPIAPILKEIKFPSENDIIPGQVAQINGLGFAKEDIVYLSNADNQKEKVEVTEITDSYLKFIVPVEAGGEYTVTIERAGKQTVLNGTFKVPFVVPIIDIVLPSGNVQPKSKVEIQGKGFEAGEKQYTYRLSSMTCLAGDVIGDVTGAKVVCMLVGERPGLVTDKSMSAYITYEARTGVLESQRTVVSNIHAQGTPAVEAGAHIAGLLETVLKKGASGVALYGEAVG